MYPLCHSLLFLMQMLEKIQAALCDFSHPDAAFRGRIVWWLARLCNAGLLIDSGWANLSCGLLRRKKFIVFLSL
jgi:hypothetical protein